ncbi:MAG: hypothetical protein M3O36_13540, partial [Myxococcota bacterium]|nr:hypothetical protein [Myxococcota bacterium]
MKRRPPQALPAAAPVSSISRSDATQPTPVFPKAPRVPSRMGPALPPFPREAPAPKRSSPFVLVSASPEPKSGWIARRGVLVATFVVCFVGLACVVGLVLTTEPRA